ncbi:amino acid ABC transporter permease [Parasporobacterium paucivorans]|uniref:Amino acid ABC transporter membrane protein, PAAT family (TC 3.A.1.3.-) n=1 Tax=Parasporobacterium paucivorans DSM 15970 TaxID=1122934 RepID=A0A1M6CRA2_9FIRM|nr:amino acid ABC transporter permease [Parasporobacterium paucivorans]SHI63615.1 amino acid ABC transporter membrane protein, PAAT family (TC 3.A.1.3.-) [Parasporobacterium paucivorans DSM 15970]
MNLGKVFSEVYPMLLDGLLITVEVTVLSLLMALVLGLCSSLMGISKVAPLRWISKAYIWIIRGTPLMVQVFYIYFALPQLLQLAGFDVRFSSFTAGVITLTLNAGAYMSEIFRGAIAAVNTGQMEAARSLGLSNGRAMRKVILPQAFRICLPSLVNQFIITLKDSSIISVIGLADIMYEAKIYVGRTMEAFASYTWTAVFYLVVITILTMVARRVERRINI